MKTLIATVLILCAGFQTGWAQKKQGNGFYEISYILPQSGQAAALESAVKEHYLYYHKTDEGHIASLRAVTEGALTGWYVWMLGPCGNAAIHPHKSDGAHDAHWNTTVEPFIQEYGDVSMWKYDPEFSDGTEEIPEGITYNVMAVDLKKGKEKEFKNILKKIQKSEENESENAIASANSIYWNLYKYGYEYDAKIVWPYAETDITSDAFKQNYESTHGAGSYQLFLKEWNKIVMDYNTDSMTNIK
ncbi:MAG: hypothetical protein ACK4IY_02775 [Chitinophagales bacterium]